MSTLEEKLEQLGPERRKGVEARSRELQSEEMTRRELTHVLKQVLVSVAKQTGVGHGHASPDVLREDLLLSTLNSYICARGGKLSLVVEFKERAPVMLTGINSLEDDYVDGDWGGFRYETLHAEWRESALQRQEESAPRS